MFGNVSAVCLQYVSQCVSRVSSVFLQCVFNVFRNVSLVCLQCVCSVSSVCFAVCLQCVSECVPSVSSVCFAVCPYNTLIKKLAVLSSMNLTPGIPHPNLYLEAKHVYVQIPKLTHTTPTTTQGVVF